MTDGDFGQALGDGALGMCEIVKVPRYIGGKWWSIPPDKSPIGLAVCKTVLQDLTDKARVTVKLSYSGGAGSTKVIKKTIRIE